MATTRRPTRAGRTPTRKPARKPAPRKRKKQAREPLLAPGQSRDLAGLALVALGLFSALVEWGGYDGALAGARLHDSLVVLVGRAAGLAPVVLIAAAAALLARVDARRLRPFRVGGVLVCIGLLLALGGSSLDRARARAQGGLVGNALHHTIATFAGEIGATLLAIVLVAGGVLLLSGASVAALLSSSANAARRGARSAGVVMRATVESMPMPTSRPRPSSPQAKVPARELDGETRFPDVFGPEVGQPAEAADESRAPEDDEPLVSMPPPFDPDPLPEVAEPSEAFEPPETIVPREPGDDVPYKLPDVRVLRKGAAVVGGDPDAERIARTLLNALSEHGVEARLIGTVSGPRVTRYELQLAPGTKVSRVSGLRDDLAYALATTELRILAPIPGKQAVGVEVPNRSPNIVTLGDLTSVDPGPGSSPLSVWLGKDIAGHVVHADLSRMPHMLIAGTTGSGKSGCINAMLCSILLRATPDEVRMILVDPKKVELNHYETIPHLLTPVVTNMKHAAAALQNIVREMETRYEIMGTYRARNLIELNRARRAKGHPPLPYILVVIDELADLMMVSPAEVEDAVIRLAQKSRAVGIHLLLATQRPSVDVITGMIKANVPSRIAFAVSSQTDSRVILDTAGAEALLGSGDMLYRPLGTSRLQRVQGAYISEEEIALLVEQCRRQQEPEFDEELLADLPDVETEELDPDEDALLDEAILCVAQHETASVSLL
ncbi:MAG: segregation ATPase FtsK/SpoIIIE, family, partial [Gaiellales bacterium]|nr:segregation ATPase FtsK/SpoIIIE, family [Gaiellales bacterium]